MSARIMITGANGFIGRRLQVTAIQRDFSVRTALRRPAKDGAGVVVGDIGRSTDWSAALEGIDVIVHLAGRAHVTREKAASPIETFRAVNVEGSVHLARQAVSAGIRRLVFVSSIGVLGTSTPPHRPHDDDTPPAPTEAYAVSKLEAEKALTEVAAQTGLELVIVRPPMVCGPGAPGNLERLMRLVHRGLLLPAPFPPNRRSLIHVQRLVDFLLLCTQHPRAAGETFVIADRDVLSTAEIIGCLGQGMGTRARLIPLPSALLSAGMAVSGMRRIYEKMYGSLVVEPAKAERLLGWQSSYDAQAGLIEAGQAFRERLLRD